MLLRYYDTFVVKLISSEGHITIYQCLEFGYGVSLHRLGMVKNALQGTVNLPLSL